MILAELTEVSQKMVELARRGEWPQVIELEPRRNLLIKKYFESLSGKEEGHHADQVALAHLVELDKQLLSLAQSAQQTVIAEVSQLAKSRQAINHYNQNKSME